MQKTFAMIKPDAVERNLIGKILARVEQEGFKILSLKLIAMSKKQAQGFYAVHSERPFFDDLTSYMSSGRTVVMVLEREEAISHWRVVMGATNPEEANSGTLRKEFGESIERNSTHGSDALETASEEIAYWFSGFEV
ncbi:MAG: nucleoside-diphosphate kinase [Nitrospinota bacterium]|nr:nucleoside-diphosphate kinase [Nitrospinota bacterium]